MSKKINTTTIGLFIVTGLALGVIGLLLFSSSKLFTQTRECILYFDDSLNGLNQGAPVKYRGVTIGSVKRVMIRFDQATNDFAMPVIVEIDKHLLEERMGEEAGMFTEELFEQRVRIGLRGFLQTESLVTGILYVEIRIIPDAVPPVYHQLKKLYLEIPTQPTQIQKFMSNLAAVDLKSIENNVNALLSKIEKAVGSLHMAQINEGLTNLLASMDRLVASPEITNDLAAVRTTLEQYRLLGEKLNRRIDPLADSITNSLADANRALGQIRGAAENLFQFDRFR